MEKHTIGGLKNILVAATDFDDIQEYFFTLTETNVAAISGNSSKNKALKDIIFSTLTMMCFTQDMIEKGVKITLVNMSMVEVRTRYFWHGSGFVNGKHIFTFFYFSDLDKGMVSLALGKDNVLFARISIKGVSKSNPMADFSDN
jgi:hypothetical protein